MGVFFLSFRLLLWFNAFFFGLINLWIVELGSYRSKVANIYNLTGKSNNEYIIKINNSLRCVLNLNRIFCCHSQLNSTFHDDRCRHIPYFLFNVFLGFVGNTFSFTSVVIFTHWYCYIELVLLIENRISYHL